MSPQARAAMLAVATLHLALWLLWGDPTPIYDEAGYLAGGEAVASLLRCTIGLAPGGSCEGVDIGALGRLAWHNPGYAALFPIASLLPGSAANWIRLIQLIAGLVAGLAVYATLRSRVSERIALAGALVIWLQPVQLFFRLTLWPVALATCALAVLCLTVARLEETRSPRRAHQAGLALLGLVFVWPMVLPLLPFVAVWALRRGRQVGTAVLGPTLAIWIPWAIVASLALGQPTAMDLAATENLALGNNPWIPAGRGSALHDPAAIERLRFEANVGCPVAPELDRLRCRAAAQRAIGQATIEADPGAAARRAATRVVETFSPDDFVARHLADPRVGRSLGHLERPVLALVQLTEWVTLLLLLCAAVGAARSRAALAALSAVVVCTSPVLLTVGLTRLRQPMLVLIVLAAALALARRRSAATYTRGR